MAQQFATSLPDWARDEKLHKFHYFMLNTPEDPAALINAKFSMNLCASCDIPMRRACGGTVPLLVFLLNHLNSKRQSAWPSNERIKINLGFDKQMLRRARNLLIENDYIAYLPGGGRFVEGGHISGTYTFNFEKTAGFTVKKVEKKPVLPATYGVAEHTLTGGKTAPKRGASATPNSNNNKINNPNKYDAAFFKKKKKKSRGFIKIGDQGEPWPAFVKALAKYGSFSDEKAGNILLEVEPSIFRKLESSYNIGRLSIDRLLKECVDQDNDDF